MLINRGKAATLSALPRVRVSALPRSELSGKVHVTNKLYNFHSIGNDLYTTETFNNNIKKRFQPDFDSGTLQTKIR